MELYVTRSNRVQAYPDNGALKHLTIDGAVFIEDLLSASRRGSLLIALSTAESLTIRHLTACAWLFRYNHVLEAFFDAVQSMSRLDSLTMEGFSLPTPHKPPPAPRCLAHSPIYVRNLVLTNAHGASLTFLLDCIAADHLLLDSCWFIKSLPDCDRLTLRRIQYFPGFVDVLAEWDGLELVVDACSFFDVQFIAELNQVMMDTREPVWPNASASLDGYSPAMGHCIDWFQYLRMHL